VSRPLKPRILVVEDEAVVADAVIYALRTDGFEPEWVSTGALALEALDSLTPDAVLLDVGLPDTSGFDLLREIRRREPGVPILFLTARGEEMDRIVGLEIGADDYVVKPFSPREVSARVRAILRRSRPVEGGEAEGNAPPSPGLDQPPQRGTGPTPFVVDERRRVVAYFGKGLDLTRTEYRLLEALLEHPGWILSRAQLLDRLWEDKGATTERAIDSHVKALRAKLRVVRSDIDPIVTHRGEGYSLRESW
jgi:two-component system catabolic regulation response regulator CreB